MRLKIIIGVFVCFLLAQVDPVQAMRELSDSELDNVTAGATVAGEFLDGTLHFEFSKDNGQRLSLDGNGSISLSEGAMAGPVGSLVVRDNAQGNLKAFINVNAVNSVVQFLINLNVNVHSNVGSLHQSNLLQGF